MPAESTFLTSDEVLALRTVLLHLRVKIGTRRIRGGAEVDGEDLHRFWSHRPPSDRFVKRLLNFIFLKSYDEFQNSGLDKELTLLRNKMQRYARLDDEDDHTFRYLRALKATSLRDCRDICHTLSGDYELYRLSAKPAGLIHKSYMRVPKFDPYTKVPKFVNSMVVEEYKKRVVDGNIIG